MADYPDVYDHRDLQATCLDVDATSQHLALVGKRYLAITRAIDPENCNVKYSRRSRWEVGCVRWCPSEMNRNYLALTSSQSYELYVLGSGGLNIVNTVRAHARIVTDLDWDYFNANRLATCSVDDNAYVWDLRDLKKPALTLNIIAGANQIKWAKLLENLCATAHDGDIRVWDIRKGTSPVQYMSAHLAKVLSLDWHPKNDVQLVSTGQDCSMKLWDFTKPTKPEVQCNLLTPVWKAKFAPFENGLLTIPTPHMSHSENALTLWNCQDVSTAVRTFLGHTDLILDFCWRRPSSSEAGDFVQIISLSKDYTVRVWTLDSKAQQLCEQRRQTPDISVNGFSTGDLDLLVDRPQFLVQRNRISSDIQQELNSLRDLNIPNIIIEEINRERSMVVVCVEHRTHVIRVAIYLPSMEFSPTSSQLSFQFSRDTTIPNSVKVSLLKRLQEVCDQKESSGQQMMLEACLKKLPELVGQMLGSEQQSSSLDNSFILQAQIMQSPSILASFLDARVPFPRTTGANFNAVGVLVCFGRNENSDNGSSDGMAPTPRSYSALASFAREQRSYFSIKNTDYSLKSYYQREWRPSRKSLSPGVKIRTQDELDEAASEVIVYDATGMILVHKELAPLYCYAESEADLVNVCMKNAAAAATVGRRDLVQAWTVLSHSAAPALRNSLDPDFESPWAMHPFGRKLISSIVEHLAKMGDVQSAAVICCVLGKRPKYQMQERPFSRLPLVSESAGGGSPYNTVHASEGLYEELKAHLSRQRSGSCSEQEGNFTESGPVSLEQFSQSDPKLATVREQDYRDRSTKLLDPDMNERFEAIKQAYADILYRWGMLNERAMVLKYSNRPPERYRGMEFVVQCKYCGADCRSPICNDCRTYAITCSVCLMAVKGLCSVCSICGHGGHTLHLATWFDSHKKCPSGCGCNCIM